MADDLDNFFAKKNAKKKQKKGGIAQTVDSLARKLERTVRQQEEFDREEEEFTQQRQTNVNVQEQTGGQQKNEDSEWIEYREALEIDLEGLPIKEMDLNEDDLSDGSDVEERSEPAKTWNILQTKDQQQPAGEVIPADDEQPTSAPKYIPPSKRFASSGGGGGGITGAAPKIENEIEFPTLAAAATIDPEKEKKKRVAWNRPMANNKPASQSPTHSASPQPPADQQQPEDGMIQTTGPVRYVPPHLRRQDVSTENRYDRLGD